MNGWAKSGESGCGERAQTIYELALEQYEQGDVDASPNSFTYSALLGKSSKVTIRYFKSSFQTHNYSLFTQLYEYTMTAS